MSSNKYLLEMIKEKSPYYLENKKRDKKVLDAMSLVDRIDFLPHSVKNLAYQDTPLPIGCNQTCSQPSMVAFMLDKLHIEHGNVILEIGAGCGYASAIASILTGPRGVVYAAEIIPDLSSFARANLASYENVVIINEDGSAGFSEYAPFDRILISAGVTSNNFSEEILLEQLKTGGFLLYPENFGNIYLLEKQKGKVLRETFFGVSFVALKGKNA